PQGPYPIVQLDRNLRPEWPFTSTNTVSCQRPPDSPPGAPPVCMDDHPNGFEWCINAPVVDRQGTVYVNSEDGNVYAIGQGGIEKQRLFLDMAAGVAHTPAAIDGPGPVDTVDDRRPSALGRCWACARDRADPRQLSRLGQAGRRRHRRGLPRPARADR